jgi:hypothetical protein
LIALRVCSESAREKVKLMYGRLWSETLNEESLLFKIACNYITYLDENWSRLSEEMRAKI